MLLAGLRGVLDQLNTADAVVPELFSGCLQSPLWFVAGNPKGEGERPIAGAVRLRPWEYVAFYHERYRDLHLSHGSSEGVPWSKTNRSYFAYADGFGDGAGIPEAERWRLLMKTNAYGVHTLNKLALLEKKKAGNVFNQLGLVGELIAHAAPAFVIGFGADADDLLAGSGALVGTDFPNVEWDGQSTVIISFRSVPAFRFTRRIRDYITELGRLWAVGGGRMHSCEAFGGQSAH